MLSPAMEVQNPSSTGGSHALFSAGLSEAEHLLLDKLSSPCVRDLSPELSHLRNIGLIYIDARSGCAEVTPLGRSWLRSQRRYHL